MPTCALIRNAACLNTLKKFLRHNSLIKSLEPLEINSRVRHKRYVPEIGLQLFYFVRLVGWLTFLGFLFSFVLRIKQSKGNTIECIYSNIPNSLRPHGLKPTRLLCPWDFPVKNAGVGCHFLLQVIFPTQGSNPGLLHCRQILY